MDAPSHAPHALRVMHVTAAPELGGLQRVICTLVEGQIGNGLTVTVAISPGGPLPERLRRLGAAVVEIPMLHGIRLSSVLRLRRFATEFGADLLHAHGARGTIYSYLANLGNRRRKLISHVHLADPWRFDGSWRARVDRYVSMHAVGIIACSENLRTLLLEKQGFPASKTTCIPNGIDLAQFEGPSRQRKGNGLIVGTCARLELQKGIEYLLDALASATRTFPGLELRIAGDGSLREHLVARASRLGLDSRVQWLGHRNDVPDILASLDLFVLPSLAEGMPLAIIEAMAAGVPVIATRIAGTVELVEHEQTGLLVPAASASALAEAILEVARRPEAARRRAEAARQRVRELHGANRMEMSVRALYAQLMSRP